jgi:hypothetical protein
MAAGIIEVTIPGIGAVKFWSDNGLSTGNLTPLQSLLGSDGANIASATNPLAPTSPTGFSVANTPTIQVAAYSANENMGGLQTLNFGALPSVLTQVAVMNASATLLTAKTIWLFDANPTASTFTDKGAFTIAAADMGKVIGVITLAPQVQNGPSTPAYASAAVSIGLPAGGVVYAAYAETSGETPASTSDLIFKYSGS